MNRVQQTRRSSLLRQPAQGAHAFRRKLYVTGQGARRRSLESSAANTETKYALRCATEPGVSTSHRNLLTVSAFISILSVLKGSDEILLEACYILFIRYN